MPEVLTLRIAQLYPTLLNVAGDRGNLLALQQRCAWRGLRTDVTAVPVGTVPDFTRFDLILFHGGQDTEMEVAARDLVDKAPSLRTAVEQEVVVLAVCAGLQLLGHAYQPARGRRLTGVGVLDIVTEGGRTRFINHAAVECTFAGGVTQVLVGFENHSGRTYLGPAAQPLGRLLAGSGNNGEDSLEGARYRQVYGTYLHGPVLPRNPWFADHLIAQGLRHRYGTVPDLAPLPDGAERQAHHDALRRALRCNGTTPVLEATPWF
ncbi:MAG: glutamine amidotransferase [Chloroflexota bacterium]